MMPRWTPGSLAESIKTLSGRPSVHADAVQRLMLKARTMLNLWRMEYAEELVPAMNAAIDALELELQAAERWRP